MAGMRAFLYFFLSVAALTETPAFSQDRPVYAGYTWKACEQDRFRGATLPFDKSGKFLPECAPDTLYHWKKHDYLERDLKQVNDSTLLPIPVGQLFTWRTPIGSYTYGEVSIRIKLRDGVKFIYQDQNTRGCASAVAKNGPNIVLAVSLSSIVRYSEYILCSDAPVHSWSYGTEEHLQEMEKEIQYIEAHKPGEFDLFHDDSGMHIPWNGGSGFKTNATRSSLDEKVNQMKKFVADQAGQIFFAKDVRQERMDHFLTKTPGYFNPYSTNAPSPKP